MCVFKSSKNANRRFTTFRFYVFRICWCHFLIDDYLIHEFVCTTTTILLLLLLPILLLLVQQWYNYCCYYYYWREGSFPNGERCSARVCAGVFCVCGCVGVRVRFQVCWRLVVCFLIACLLACLFIVGDGIVFQFILNYLGILKIRMCHRPVKKKSML